jgi:hypothetical protein
VLTRFEAGATAGCVSQVGLPGLAHSLGVLPPRVRQVQSVGATDISLGLARLGARGRGGAGGGGWGVCGTGVA